MIELILTKGEIMKEKVIIGDNITQQDLEKLIQNHRLQMLEMERNRIRLDTKLSQQEKDLKNRMLFYRMQSLKENMRN
jgi:hypothetical protein